MEIFYDSLQEGTWFKNLNPEFSESTLTPINDIQPSTEIAKALEYDRPDIILADQGKPILVIERTIEVPTGHNVGQRFARLAAAAEAKIPLVYFGPYMAKKHGGETAGPRYMNLRLFYALDVLSQINKAAVTTINWPVDKKCELLRTPEKDAEMKSYIELFLVEYKKKGLAGINEAILKSPLQSRSTHEREKFITDHVRAPKEYDTPPPSVKILTRKEFCEFAKVSEKVFEKFDEIVLYDVGMKYVRSDPYTGMGMLYRYLYVLGEKAKARALVLHFPEINKVMWDQASKSEKRKDVRLFKHIAEFIVLSDGTWIKETAPAPIKKPPAVIG
jgi:hypothetical protein